MITRGNTEYRNLQEQVLQNKNDIQYILEEAKVLNEFGIKVVGVVENINQLPNPTTYEGEYGDAYAVGTEAPYTLYIWTRQVSGQTGDWWFNIGVFPAPSTVPGPIGPQGIQGIAGARGSLWYSQTGAPTNKNGVNTGDQALDGTTGNVYMFVSGNWQLTGNIRGPQGIQGIQGIIGPIGPVGPIGPQGPKGDPASPVEIYGELENTNQLPMPDTVPRYAAYLIPDAAGDQHIWLQIGEGTTESPILWHDAGKFSNNGSTVTIDGINQASIELGYIPKISVNYEIGEDTTVSSNGSEVTFSNMQTTGYNASNEQIEGMGTIELPIASSNDIELSVESNVLKLNLSEEVKESIENANSPIVVQINAPSTATNGQLDETQLATLQGNRNALLMFNNEVYRAQDIQHTTGYIVYSHIGYENTTQVYNIKCITITLNTRGWVLTTREVIDPNKALKVPTATSAEDRIVVVDTNNKQANVPVSELLKPLYVYDITIKCYARATIGCGYVNGTNLTAANVTAHGLTINSSTSTNSVPEMYITFTVTTADKYGDDYTFTADDGQVLTVKSSTIGTRRYAEVWVKHHLPKGNNNNPSNNTIKQGSTMVKAATMSVGQRIVSEPGFAGTTNLKDFYSKSVTICRQYYGAENGICQQYSLSTVNGTKTFSDGMLAIYLTPTKEGVEKMVATTGTQHINWDKERQVCLMSCISTLSNYGGVAKSESNAYDDTNYVMGYQDAAYVNMVQVYPTAIQGLGQFEDEE